MKRESFFRSRVQIIVGVIVKVIQTAAGVLDLQEQIQSQWRGLISNKRYQYKIFVVVKVKRILSLTANKMLFNRVDYLIHALDKNHIEEI